MLGRVLLVLQAPRLDGPFFDLRSPFDDGRVPPEVGVGGCYVFDALVITTGVVVSRSPAYLVIKAADEFRDKTAAPNQLWQTDFTYLKVIGWG
jgi:hypothetical protein